VSAAECGAPACHERVWAKGLCARHYERERQRHRHGRTDQRIQTRARNRALARLSNEYRDRFEEIYAEERVRAEAEDAEVRQRLGIGEDEEPPKLMSGPRPPAEPEAVQRVRLDVAECPRCHGYHDNGHRCPECKPVLPSNLPNDLASEPVLPSPLASDLPNGQVAQLETPVAQPPVAPRVIRDSGPGRYSVEQAEKDRRERVLKELRRGTGTRDIALITKEPLVYVLDVEEKWRDGAYV
jgi:hypothetical protein